MGSFPVVDGGVDLLICALSILQMLSFLVLVSFGEFFGTTRFLLEGNDTGNGKSYSKRGALFVCLFFFFFLGF